MRSLVATGFAVGLSKLPGLRFQPDKPYTFCRICGTAYQTAKDRALNPSSNPIALAICEQNRKAWSHDHAKQHTVREHTMLNLSGRFCTPEAAQVLAALGVIGITDLVRSNEHEAAYAESTPIPKGDCEE